MTINTTTNQRNSLCRVLSTDESSCSLADPDVTRLPDPSVNFHSSAFIYSHLTIEDIKNLLKVSKKIHGIAVRYFYFAKYEYWMKRLTLSPIHCIPKEMLPDDRGIQRDAKRLLQIGRKNLSCLQTNPIVPSRASSLIQETVQKALRDATEKRQTHIVAEIVTHCPAIFIGDLFYGANTLALRYAVQTGNDQLVSLVLDKVPLSQIAVGEALSEAIIVNQPAIFHRLLNYLMRNFTLQNGSLAGVVLTASQNGNSQYLKKLLLFKGKYISDAWLNQAFVDAVLFNKIDNARMLLQSGVLSQKVIDQAFIDCIDLNQKQLVECLIENCNKHSPSEEGLTVAWSRTVEQGKSEIFSTLVQAHRMKKKCFIATNAIALKALDVACNNYNGDKHSCFIEITRLILQTNILIRKDIIAFLEKLPDVRDYRCVLSLTVKDLLIIHDRYLLDCLCKMKLPVRNALLKEVIDRAAYVDQFDGERQQYLRILKALYDVFPDFADRPGLKQQAREILKENGLLKKT